VPVLANGKCRTGRLWIHVRDDQPFGGKAPPVAVFNYSPNCEGEHAERVATYTGILQAKTSAGFNALFMAGRVQGPIIEAPCWAHGTRMAT
jgi:transposase